MKHAAASFEYTNFKDDLIECICLGCNKNYQQMLDEKFDCRKCFEVIENVPKFNFERDWTKLRPKICLLRQSWTKYLA